MELLGTLPHWNLQIKCNEISILKNSYKYNSDRSNPIAVALSLGLYFRQ